MYITVLTKKNKYIQFNTEDASTFLPLDSEIFEFMEQLWWEWFEEESEHNCDIDAMYFSDEACYTKKGAIRQGIEQLIEYAEEQNKTFYTENDLHNIVDITCAFN